MRRPGVGSDRGLHVPATVRAAEDDLRYSGCNEMTEQPVSVFREGNIV